MGDEMALPAATSEGYARTSATAAEPRPSGRRYWPLRTRGLAVLAVSFLVATAIWTGLGLFVVHVLDDTFFGRRELALSTWFAEHRTPRMDTLSEYGSMLSDTLTKVTAVPLLGAVFVIVWRRWHDAVFLAAVLLFEVCVFAATAYLVGRDRPPVEQLDGSLPTNSFPSGHVAAAVAFYVGLLVIARWHTRRPAVIVPVACLAVLAPLIVAVSRLYRGMHYLSDVLAGAALGAASLVITYAALRVGVEQLRNRGTEPVPIDVTQLDLTEGRRP
jgi:undecaprenyl-diphosphatase